MVWQSFASIGDSFEAVRDGQMFRSPPFEDCITSLDVHFLDKAVPNVLIPDIIKVTTSCANIERYLLKYNDQRVALWCYAKFVNILISSIISSDPMYSIVRGVNLGFVRIEGRRE